MPLRKYFKPSGPIAILGHAAQSAVVIVASRLEEGREVKKGSWQNASFTQLQRNQQTSHPAIPVEERVDGFELIVRQGRVHKRWHDPVVHEGLPRSQMRAQRFGRRWNEGSLRQRAARLPNPILRLSKIARRRMAAPHSAQQPLVKLPHKPQRYRQTLKSLYPVLESRDVISNLPEIIRTALDRRARLLCEQLAKSGLGAFNAARENGLPPHKRSNQNVRIRQSSPFTSQLPHQPPMPPKEQSPTAPTTRSAAVADWDDRPCSPPTSSPIGRIWQHQRLAFES